MVHSISFSFSLLVCSLLITIAFTQTTPFIAEVFVGKCYERNPSGAVNCTQLWNAFSQAAMIGNNIVNDSYYIPFFNLADFSTAKDNILFWSGNQAFALALSNNGAQYTTVEETSSGYVLNGLSWCGVENSNPPAFDYNNTCYYPSNSTYYGTQGVWAQCSQRFARGATGHVTVLLQPSRLNYDSGPYLAYRNTSVFYLIELPNMNISQVTSMTVLVLANTTLAPGEKCGNGSLEDLTSDVNKKFGFNPTCIDDPKTIYNILCPDGNTASPQCLAATLAYSESPNSQNGSDNYLIWALITSELSAVLAVLATYFALRTRYLSQSNYIPVTRE